MEHIAKLRWTAVHQFLQDKRGVRYFFATLGVTLITGIGLLVWMWQLPGASAPTAYSAATPPPKPMTYTVPLTGASVTDKALTTRPVTAVMIENSPDARPQSGLKDAGVIYEAIAEGGITRFVALYQEARPALIGPVRSVRPYYVEWASAYDPGMAHIGGSSRALQMIRSGTYGVDLDQFFNAGSYWRASDRYAPHNVYTNFDQLDALNASKNKTSSSFTALARKTDQKAKAPTASHINLPISSPLYNVDYDYEATSNSYLRKVGGEAHVDRETGQIAPKVVIALQAAMSRQLEDGYREQIVTTGTGRAWIFQDGSVSEVTWQRPEAKSQITFVDSSGKTVNLNAGQTWITALPNEKAPSWQ